MNNRHLPAGQAMQGAGGPGPEMGPGTAGVPRRRQYNPQHYVPQQPVAHNMYGGYNMGHPAYGMQHPQPYYQQPISPYGQPGTMPVHNTYMPYQHQHYPARSPPAHALPQHYAPIVTSGMGQPPYGRQQQHSPAMSSPYPPPPHHSTPIPSHTPTSTHSSQAVGPPPGPPAQSSTPPASQPAKAPSPTPKPVESVVEPEPVPAPIPREPFRPPLPWYSRPDESFPKRTKKKRKRAVPKDTAVELPSVAPPEVTETSAQEISKAPQRSAEVPRPDTPPTSVESSTSPTSPDAAEPTPTQTPPAKVVAEPKPPVPALRPAVPAVPVVPVVPKKDAKPVAPPAVEKSPEEPKVPDESQATSETAPTAAEQASQPKPAPAPKPKTWSGLFTNTSATRTSAPANGSAGAGAAGNRSTATIDGSAPHNGNTGANTLTKSGPTSLSDALRSYKVGGSERLSFIEPRGLINTGNMCYMNSVLQVLIFCIPFYDFLDQVYKRAAHSFKTETPILDAMVLFMQEFRVIALAPSVEQLRRRLKNEELEQFGEQFTPDFVYEAIRKHPRFASMRRGHQQDAEEFLGFLLESLHDECSQVMRSNATTAASNSSTSASSPSSVHDATDANGWLEVGPRQRAAVTRSSGTPHVSSPVTKIFGGQLRSELRVPGLKDSVTLEPYQPLQLDIGAPNVRNIVDALKGLTNPEILHGDFNSPRGKDVKATKQVFIESLPPVLILHLKRFQFDAEGNGTIKIWKKVGYPLELEIPKEVFSRQKRNSIAPSSELPKYKLSAVVYHHGKNASGGHYTVDALRQDGREWIRLDDTVIRRIGSEDVAEGGAEEDAKTTSADNRKDGIVGGSNNRFAGINEDETGDEDGWKQVTAQAGKKWSSVVNGGSSSATATPKGKQVKESIKDNKVAYLLFYQRM